MTKPDILFLAPLPEFLSAPLRARYECHECFGDTDTSALVARIGQSIRGIVGSGGTNYGREVLERLPCVEIISVFGAGYDGVPVGYCQGRGIRVTNTPDVLTDDVADIALALVLMTSRKLAAANRYLHDGKWPGGPFELASSLRGKAAGILGLGRIGKGIAARLGVLGMDILYHGRKAQPVPFRFVDSLIDLAHESDFLVVACAGGAETRHLVNADVLAALGREGTLINIARGSIVDEAALVLALEAGTINAAGLDVFENEPHVSAGLLQCDRTVLLPHVGSATRETRGAMADLVVRNLAAHFAGQPLLTPVV